MPLGVYRGQLHKAGWVRAAVDGGGPHPLEFYRCGSQQLVLVNLGHYGWCAFDNRNETQGRPWSICQSSLEFRELATTARPSDDKVRHDVFGIIDAECVEVEDAQYQIVD